MSKVCAQVVELVDTPDLGSGAARYVGSSPILGNIAEDTFRSEGVFALLGINDGLLV